MQMSKRQAKNWFKRQIDKDWLKETLNQQYEEYSKQGFFCAMFTVDKKEFCSSYLIRLLKVIEFIPPEYMGKIINVLDVGCGEGQLALVLKKNGFNVFGVDKYSFNRRINTQGQDVGPCLKKFLKDNEIEIKEIDVEKDKIPYTDSLFDLVICNAVIEHLHNSPEPLMKEMKRVLKPGGYLIVNVPNYASLDNRIDALLGKSHHESIDNFYFHKRCLPGNNDFIGHVRLYTIAELKQIFLWEGFREVYWETFEACNPTFGFRELFSYLLKGEGSGLCLLFKKFKASFRSEIIIRGKK